MLLYEKDIMSNQFTNGTQPFIKGDDDQYKDLSVENLKYILKMKKYELMKNYKGLTERQKLIRDIKRVSKLNDRVLKGVDIKKKCKQKKKENKPKSFDEYFKVCLENKVIPEDTPDYLRKALERALREYSQGLIKEKSAFQNFTSKYVIEGEFGFTPMEYFNKHYLTLKIFLKDHKNILFSFVLVCLMEKQEIDNKQGVIGIKEVKGYFNSGTRKNLVSTDEDYLIKKSVKKIIKKFEEFQKNGSGWYFKEVLKLEIHTVDFVPLKGTSYLPLPDWIKNRQAIINIKNKDDKCFIWSVLRHLYPKKKDNPEYIGDLKVYENTLNTKGLIFPMSLKDISKFEKLNPLLPGINVFSHNKKMKIYPLRLAERDCKCTIDLFFHTDKKPNKRHKPLSVFYL